MMLAPRRITMILASAAFVALLSTCAMPEATTRTAIIFGVASYTEYWNGREVDNPNLTLTDNDARDMSSMLTRMGWVVNVTGIAESTDAVLNSASASREAIESAILSLAGTEGPVLFYYSGHGWYNGYDYVIQPYGSVVPNAGYTSYTLNPDSYISAAELSDMFSRAGLKDVIVLLDSCYSGGFVEAGATVDAVPDDYSNNLSRYGIKYSLFFDALSDSFTSYIDYVASTGNVVISAAGSNEFSWESGTNGIFTGAILAASETSSSDFDGDGYLSTSELYRFCVARIDATWNSSTTYNDFLPHLSGTAREYALWEAAE